MGPPHPSGPRLTSQKDTATSHDTPISLDKCEMSQQGHLFIYLFIYRIILSRIWRDESNRTWGLKVNGSNVAAGGQMRGEQAAVWMGNFRQAGRL